MPAFRRFTSLLEDAPQKTIGAVAPAAPAAVQSAGKLKSSDLASLPLGWDIQNSVFGSLAGLNGTDPGNLAPWQTASSAGAANEGGGVTSLGAESNFDALKDYTFDWKQGDKKAGTLTAYDKAGNVAGKFDQTPEQSLLGGMLEWGGLAAAGFGGLGALGLGPLGALGGAGAGAGNGAFLGEGVASGVPAWDAAAGLGAADAGVGASLGALDAGGFGDLSALLGAPQVEANALGSFGAINTAAPVLGEATAFGALPELSALAQGGAAITPFGSFALPAVEAASAAPAVFNAAADSQLASSQLGITGAQSAANATIPATVNLVNAGGTMGTAGGLAGTLAALKQDAGGLLGGASSFMKDNPLLGRLILGGASGLLGGLGGSGGGSASSGTSKTYGPPVQWTSPIQQGVYTAPTLYQPKLQSTGLLNVSGVPNSGAWQWMKG